MKILPIALLSLVSVGFVACSSETATNENKKPNTEVNNTKQISVNDIITQFKADGLPVGVVLEHTAETDPNHKLGRPNEYIASAKFEDKNVEQIKQTPPEIEVPEGGIIEIFNNPQDLEVRKKYIESVFESMPMLKQYMIAKGNVLLRLEYKITPENAKKYELSLEKVAK